MPARIVLILITILMLPLLTSCNLTGENVLVYIDRTEKQEIIKVNALTNYNKEKKALSVIAIMDVYDEEKKYLRTTIFNMDGSVEKTVTHRHEEGPMTILTKHGFDPQTIKLNSTNQEKVKLHILQGITILKDKESSKKKEDIDADANGLERMITILSD
ncbi:hypothetical protein [Litchfieldia salsa]|uniref:Lipoprotein n=1 Tax=Litchfieldia salsa TaxID=930152 RepID=A0A1H0WWF6_9BACI|nr:hypothetical protein [Litchfieldia salsa]SDP94765.1 hypothetical protein SAMN05216565_1175 [Litchfieldia salsa]